MKLKELRQIASVDMVFVVFIDKNGHETKERKLEVIAKHDEDYVARVEAVLDTSSPNEVNGGIQVVPCLQAWVFHQEK